jgi:methylglutaconyl-CoA hydratase
MAMDEQLVITESTSPTTLILSLNRPDKRNALSVALIEALTAAIEGAATDLARRVVILRGEGPSFCAGLDLKEVADPAMAHRSAESLAKLYETICTSPLVIIAAAHGSAMGGGAGLVAAADMVVAADDLAVGFPEVRRGLTAALVLALLRRQLADRTMREIIILAQTLDARRCDALGLATQVVSPAELRPAALKLAEDVVAGAPGAIVATKRLLGELAARPIREDLQIALRQHLATRTSPETAEGVAAFREKRPPRWGSRSE